MKTTVSESLGGVTRIGSVGVGPVPSTYERQRVLGWGLGTHTEKGAARQPDSQRDRESGQWAVDCVGCGLAHSHECSNGTVCERPLRAETVALEAWRRGG